MSKKILHIAGCDKFIPPFIEFMKEYFDFSAHDFLIMEGIASKELKITPNVHHSKRSIPSRLKHYWQAMIKMHQADKVILHGLFDIYLVIILFFMPWLLKKCYWIMWGGDFYFPEKQSWIKKQVIKKMGYLITSMRGDYKYVKQYYRIKGKRIDCFVYPSNLYKEYNIKPKKSSTINIQLGNSADPTNNHFEVLEQLVKCKNEDIKIFTPLSYGNEEYSQSVITKGKELFGEKFISLTEFMTFEKYLEFLSEIDIAVFAHKRQQAMGNIITLLGLGKKIYLRSDITTWDEFKEMGIEIYDVAKIDLELIGNKTKKNNIQKIKNKYSRINLIKDLTRVFDE
jgi:dTDP-N-acetylfucosamine:lipid II N-acetylfucosaminyltransferase